MKSSQYSAMFPEIKADEEKIWNIGLKLDQMKEKSTMVKRYLDEQAKLQE
jgi:hypothetical protein